MHRDSGSLWWKWDLHVHTPASIINNLYGGNSDETWERFLSDLEGLPEDFKVLGINDYIFLEGYRRVLAAKNAGRLANIELILPVIELRIDKFGGTDGNLSRINFHTIFSNELDPALIETQFINALRIEARLTPSATVDRPTFSGIVTREALEDFGRAIVSSVPKAERQKFQSPLIEGFNNLNFTLESVRKALKATYFENRVLTAVGKTEWWNIKWNNQSIADKKDIINGADFVFIAAEDSDHCQKALASLTKSEVNNRLLDCSDAHDLSDASIKDRIGNCYTWLCADTEFDGLRQVRKEPDGRVFLGDEPPQRVRLRQAPRQFIQSVEIRRTGSGVDPNDWLDGTSLSLNPSLVAVIGRKGSGKSALVDTLGLLGSSTRMAHASFLNPSRFRSSGLAKNFTGTLHWYSGDPVECCLGNDPEAGAVAELNFIPQDFFEEVCNELIGRTEGHFDDELKQVIYSHVHDDERLGTNSPTELIALQTVELEEAIRKRRGDLSKINSRIVALEALLEPAARNELAQSLERKREELAAHGPEKPHPVPRPPGGEPRDGDAPILVELTEKLEAAESAMEAATVRRGELVAHIALGRKLRQRLSNFEEVFQTFLDESEDDFTTLGTQVSEILHVEIRTSALDEITLPLVAEKKVLDEQLDPDTPGELVQALQSAKEALEKAKNVLEAPQRDYEQYLSDTRNWQKKHQEILGAPDTPDSIRGLASRCRRLGSLPTEITVFVEQRIALVREIHEGLLQIANRYREIFGPVQVFTQEHALIADEFDLRFDVSVDIARFKERFIDRIHNGRVGSFRGRDASENILDGIVGPRDFNSTDETLMFIEEILSALRTDHQHLDRPKRHLADQLLEGETEAELLDFLCGLNYLAPRYRIQLGDRTIEQLSPGEKGALLLVFYLLVDKSENPLVIDQPEGNLDNETVFRLLVPSIKLAKQRRQIIMVTHNPNLAVVCDAEQIIVARRISDPSVSLEYVGGAIEHTITKEAVVDILEGTRPAFSNREMKYVK